MPAGGPEAARAAEASEAGAQASIRVAAREAPRSAAWGYVPWQFLHCCWPEPLNRLRCRTFDPASPPASLAGSAFFPGAALVEGGKRRPPERMRRLHDLSVMKIFEAQVPFMGVPRGFVELLQFGIDCGH